MFTLVAKENLPQKIADDSKEKLNFYDKQVDFGTNILQLQINVVVLYWG